MVLRLDLKAIFLYTIYEQLFIHSIKGGNYEK